MLIELIGYRALLMYIYTHTHPNRIVTNMPAQFKAFLDSTGGLWRTQQLAGKPAGIFLSTGSQGGGQETTALTAITQLVHHGMIFVPIGYSFGAGMFEMDNINGGSPYGSGTYAGDGSTQPTQLELAQRLCLINLTFDAPD
ncbi:probable NAD(P)H dehydrogenase (quinone) FQR1-like 1 [Solanum dulcamara]|uniref:probable NAD(P)H dehydrogenase (quinone) FQR1-like 1 n=1 Tax=Solanum dulcamara TaxID=45834 RepID=UPI0024868F3D|nr:probable NAD(P)H dehydrogenase (quinone) FQR1-like 1 [Solanum dulcamara]